MRALAGGSSSAVHAIDVDDRRGACHRLVLRRFLRPKWKHPRLPRREAGVLDLLRGSGLPAPRHVAIDPRADACDAPALLMTRLPGRTVLAPDDVDPWLAEQARLLPAIHAVSLPEGARVQPFRPFYDARKLGPPAWSARPEAWRAVLSLAKGRRPRSPRRLIHRDYHPANLLWRRGRVSGVVDWLNAAIGPAEVDVAHCRRNLATMFGVAMADRFLDAYCAVTGAPRAAYDPYWDALLLVDGSLEASIFQGWTDLGFPITQRQVCARLDQYAVSIAARC